MLIFVATCTGKSTEVEVEGVDTVRELKAKMFRQNQIAPDLQRLIFGAVEMEDGRTLASYNVQLEDTIHLATKLKVGEGDGVRRATDAYRSQLDGVCRSMRREWVLLAERQDGLKARQDDLQKRHSGGKLKEKLKINVGGVKMTVLRSVMVAFERTRLAALFSGRWDSQLLRDGKNRIFLDIDPRIFQSIYKSLQLCHAGNGQAPLARPFVPPELGAALDLVLEFFNMGNLFAAADGAFEEADPPEEPEPEPEHAVATAQAPAPGAWRDFPLADVMGQALAAIEAERSALCQAIARFEAMENAFAIENSFVQYFTKAADGNPAPAALSEVVHLNAGGPLTVRRATLTLCAESALARHFSGGEEAATADEDDEDDNSDSDDEEEISDDPVAFRTIIDQLRLRAMAKPGRLPPPPVLEHEQQRASFQAVLAKYFGGVEGFILTAPKPNLQVMRASKMYVHYIHAWFLNYAKPAELHRERADLHQRRTHHAQRAGRDRAVGG